MADDLSGFISGFARGFGQSYQQVAAAKRLRDQLGFEREKFQWQKTEAEKDDARLQQQLDLQRKGVDITTQQFEHTKTVDQQVEEHRTYADKLAKQQADAQELQARLTSTDKIASLVANKDGLPPKMQAKLFDIYVRTMGVDPKDANYKDMRDLITSQEATPEQKQALSNYIITQLPNYPVSMHPQLIQKFMTDPAAGMEVLTSAKKYETEKQAAAAKVAEAEKFRAESGKEAAQTELAIAKTGETLARTDTIRRPRFTTPQTYVGPDGREILTTDPAALEGMPAPGKGEMKVVQEAPGVYKYVRGSRAEGMRAPAPPNDFEAFTREETYKADTAAKNKLVEDAAATNRIVQGPLATFRQGLERGDFVTGPGSDVRKNIGKLALMLGGDPTKIPYIGNPATAEQMEQSAALVSQSFANTVNRLTNMGLHLVVSGTGDINKTPEGNALFIEMFTKLSQRENEIAAKAQEYMNKYGSLEPDGKQSFYSWRAQYNTEHPPIDKDLEKRALKMVENNNNMSWQDAVKFITGQAGAAEEAIGLGKAPAEDEAPREFVTVGSGMMKGTAFPVTRIENGRRYVTTTQGDFPVAESMNDLRNFKPGDKVLLRSTGQVVTIKPPKKEGK